MVQVKRWSSILLILSTAAFSFADPVDDFVAQEMKTQHIAGLTIGVLDKDQLVRIQGYGVADVETQTPASGDTSYVIASITKQFTAMAIMMLVEEGKIGLDDKLSKYVPESPERWKEITIRQLLNHTSGIKNFLMLPQFDYSAPAGGSHDSFMKLVRDLPLDFAPGSAWSYNNSGYYLLGMVIENVSGMPYREFLKQRIFDPLGMNSTKVNDLNETISNGASPYWWTPSGWHKHPPEDLAWSFSLGAIVCPVSDFAKWAAALYEKKLLQPESYRALYASARLTNGTSYPYGFGWNLSNFRGHSELFHRGNLAGFESGFVRWPSDGLSVIVFTNSSPANAVEIARGISGLYNPKLTPLAMLSTQESPKPEVDDKVKELISHFADDPNAGVATDRPKISPLFADLARHITDLQYLDRDERSNGSSIFYYRAIRDDGEQILTVYVNKSDQLSSFACQPPKISQLKVFSPEQVKDLILRLANKDLNADIATPGLMQKFIGDPKDVAIFVDMAQHGRDVQYLGQDFDTGRLYYRFIRDDRQEMLTLVVADGRVTGIFVKPLRS